MSLIFDQFKTRKNAEKFAASVSRFYPDLESQVFDSEEEAFAHDPFPFALNGTIVHVDRSENPYVEDTIQRIIAPKYGGVFAGT